MFASRVIRFSSVLAAVWATALAAAEPAAIKLPGTVNRGVVSGDHFFAVTEAGNLIDVDLKQQKVRDLSTPDSKLKPFVDVLDGKACVANDGRVLILDLADGKVVGSAEFKGEVAGLGFAGADRVWVRSPTSVTILDTAAGKTVKAVEFGSADSAKLFWHHSQFRSGDRLYAAHAADGGTAVIDLARGEAVTTLKTTEWRVGGVYADKSSVYVLGVRLGYGVWTSSFGRFDLKTGQYTALKLPGRALYEATLSAGPDGTILVHGLDGVIQVDAQGKVLSRIERAIDFRHLVGHWNGRLLFGGDELRLVSPAPYVAPASAAKE